MERSAFLLLHHVIAQNFLYLLQGHVVDIEFSKYLSSAFLVAEGFLEYVLDVGAKLGLELEEALRWDGLDYFVEEAHQIVDEGIVDFHYEVNIAVAVPGV